MSYDDFRIIKANVIADPSLSKPLSTTDRQQPYVMYTDPQLGHIGLHEHEAKKKYGDDAIKTASMPMAWVARALEIDESRGLMKAVVHADTEQILGFTCLGLEGGEVMSIVQTAMMGGLKYTVLQNAIYAHPSLAESLNNVWGYLK
jgi:pyruvate/2-oxoglutarate dehydrogenase complex dihydrolipoamide dehydrogenase (E3) component